MDSQMIALVAVAVVVAVFFFVVKGKKKKSPQPPVVTPTVTSEPPVVVDGVWLGKYYGAIDVRRCVTVTKVEDGLVTFLTLNRGGSDQMELPVSMFLARYTHFPDGCPYDYN